MGISPLSLFTVAASGLQAQTRSVEIIANNLANASTPGFKPSRANLQDVRLTEVQPPDVELGGGVILGAISRDFNQGVLTTTGNPLDLAIEGPGFFEIQLADGRRAYTRDGSFHLDGGGRLVTADGLIVGPGITAPAGFQEVVVAADGTVTARQADGTTTPIGTINLARFANPDGLQSFGNNLLVETAASGPPQVGAPGTVGRGQIHSGVLEGSGVEIANEFVNMLVAQRSYSLSLRVLQTLDEMQRQANAIAT